MSKTARVDVYLDTAHEWRWRAIGRNGAELSNSGEGYKNKPHAIEMAQDQHPDATLIIHDREGGEPSFAEDTE